MGGHKYQEIIWNDFEHRGINSEAGRRGGKTRSNGAKAYQNIMIDLIELFEHDYQQQELVKAGKLAPEDVKPHFKQQTNNPDCKEELPRLLYWFVAPTFKHTKAMKKAFLQYCPKSMIQYQSRTANCIWLYPDIQIEFKSADNPDSLVSEGLNGLWLTETARMKKTVWNENLKPCLSDKNGWFLSDTTPKGMNWYVTEIGCLADPNDDRFDESYVLYHWLTIDNDKIPGIIEEVARARKTMPKAEFERNYEANRDAFSGQIYTEFKKSIHVDEFDFDRSRYKVVLGGQDWGYTHHGVLYIAGITFDDEVDVIHIEAHQKILVEKPADIDGSYTKKTWCDIAYDAYQKYDINMIYCGPDRPEDIAAYKARGIPCCAANNSVASGISFVHSLMVVDDNGKSRYRVHKSCELLIQNHITQKWKEDPNGDHSEEPEKLNDDANDAERYCLFSGKKWFNIRVRPDEMGDDDDD